MNELVRPSMYDSYHEIEILSAKNSTEVVANVCGNICESGDVLAKERKIKLPKVGDIIIVYNAELMAIRWLPITLADQDRLRLCFTIKKLK